MKLYNVEIEASYEASYEGTIERNYTRLVFADTKEDAINFVNKDLEHLKKYWHVYEKPKTAYEIDTSKGERKRKTQYYVA